MKIQSRVVEKTKNKNKLPLSCLTYCKRSEALVPLTVSRATRCYQKKQNKNKSKKKNQEEKKAAKTEEEPGSSMALSIVAALLLLQL